MTGASCIPPSRRSCSALVLRALVSASLLACHGGAFAQVQATSAGTFTVKAGQALALTSPNAAETVIELSQPRTILDWAHLGVGRGQSLQFKQSGVTAVVLNRVTGSNSTAIDGRLSSNGQVWIVNPNGVFFGPGSEVNVQGLLASTQSLSDQDFLSGRYHFTGGGSSAVANLGQLVARDGGYVILAGTDVSNKGWVQARLGQVVLASGKSFTLDLAGDGLLRFDVTSALTGADAQVAQVLNSGVIQADGGRVQLMARAAQDLTAKVVNMGGLVQANSVRQVQGEIVLDAGPQGISEIAGDVIAQGLEASSAGGRITVLGDRIDLKPAAMLDTSGPMGGGRVLVGGNWQGRGDLLQAGTVNMDAGAQIKANASDHGSGGQVVLWSDVYRLGGQTRVAGSLEARGGAFSGDGGQIETSGRSLSIAESARVNAGSPTGASGQWLLDPVNVTIDASNSGAIQAALANNHVLVTTTGADPNWSVMGAPFVNQHGSESGSAGNIYVNASLSWTKNVLSLQAHGNVFVNAPLTAGAVFDVGLNTTLFGGLFVRTGYSTPGADGGTYDSSKTLQFGTHASGFAGRLDLLDAGGLPRSGGGFFLNDVNYTVIHRLDQLKDISGNLSGNYALAGDVDASATQNWSAGLGFEPIGSSSSPFTGRFNGLGHVVSNVTIDRQTGPGSQNIGFFGWNAGSVASIGLSGGVVRGHSSVGALAGTNAGEISNSYASTTVSAAGSSAGGLVGSNGLVGAITPAVVASSSASGAVSGSQYVGGLIGWNEQGHVLDSHYIGGNTVSSSNTSAGGLVGVNSTGGLVSRSSASGVVAAYSYSGGLVGSNINGAEISYSKALPVAGLSGAQVSAYDKVGGVAGQNTDSTISNSSSDVIVSGMNNVGGLVGMNFATSNHTAVIDGSYAKGLVQGGGYNNGQPWGIFHGGLVGVNDNEGGVAIVRNSYASSNVSSVVGLAGGLVGINTFRTGTAGSSDKSVVENSYATGNLLVIGNAPVGGLVGVNEATIRNVYSSGAINSAASPAAVIGQNEPSGVVNQAYAPVAVASKSASSYAGLDFSPTGEWFIYEGQTTPLLRSFLTPLTVTVSSGTVASQIYSGTTAYEGSVSVAYSQNTNASLLGSMTVQLSSKDVGDRPLQLGGLYSDQHGYLISYLDQVGPIRVNPKVLTVLGTAASNKIYDGTTAASISHWGGAFTGVGNEMVQVTPGVASFGDKMAGQGKTVTVTGLGLADGTGGGLASNYQLSSTSVTTTANIDRAPLLVRGITAQDKAYDGTQAATLQTAGVVYDGLIVGDNVALGSIAGMFMSKDVGQRTVLYGGALTGTDVSNYAVSYGSTTANITPKALTVLGTTAANKMYDGSTAATVTNAGFVETGIANETLQLNASAISANFADSEAGVAKTVTVTGYALADGTGGGLASNYTLNGAAVATADIQGLSTKPEVAILTSMINDVVTTATSNLSISIAAPAIQTPASPSNSTPSLPATSTATQQTLPVANSDVSSVAVAAPSTASVAAAPSTAASATPEVSAGAAPTPVANSALVFGSDGVQVATVSLPTTPAAAPTPVVPITDGTSATPTAAPVNTASESRSVSPPVRPSPTTAVAKALEQGAAGVGGSRMVVVSVDTGLVAAPTLVGAPTLKPPEIPKSIEEQRDPVLASLPVRNAAASTNSVPVSTSSGLGVVSTTQQISASLSGLANFETTLPRSSATSAEDYRFSVSGNRSRW